MRRGLRWFGLVLLLASVFPALGADDKKDEKKPAPPAEEKKKDEKKAPDKKKAAPPAPAKGRLKDTQIVHAKLGKLDGAPRYGIVVQEPYLNNDGKVAFRDKEVELEAADDLIVRTNILAPRFDEKGNPIRKNYTPKELKELAGPDRTLPGYTADVDNLKSGQIVNVYVRAKKNAPKTDPPVIVLIHILAEPGN